MSQFNHAVTRMQTVVQDASVAQMENAFDNLDATTAFSKEIAALRGVKGAQHRVETVRAKLLNSAIDQTGKITL